MDSLPRVSPSPHGLQRLSHVLQGPSAGWAWPCWALHFLSHCTAHLGFLELQAWKQHSVEAGPRWDSLQHLDDFPSWTERRVGRICEGPCQPCPLVCCPHFHPCQASPGLANRPTHRIRLGSRSTSTESGPWVTTLPQVNCSCSS